MAALHHFFDRFTYLSEMLTMIVTIQFKCSALTIDGRRFIVTSHFLFLAANSAPTFNNTLKQYSLEITILFYQPTKMLVISLSQCCSHACQRMGRILYCIYVQ